MDDWHRFNNQFKEWPSDKQENKDRETINGLKRAMEVMEGALEQKDQRIKELEETCYDYLKSITRLECEISDLSWRITNERFS